MDLITNPVHGEISTTEVIPVGALLTITTGEYSDYSVNGVFRALKAINADMLLAKWAKDNPEQAERYHFRPDEFLAHLSKEGYLETVPCWEFHLSDYSCMEEHQVTKMEP